MNNEKKDRPKSRRKISEMTKEEFDNYLAEVQVELSQMSLEEIRDQLRQRATEQGRLN